MPALLSTTPSVYSRPRIPGVYWRACWNKGGKLKLGVEKSGTDILCLNKITLINHPLGNPSDPNRHGLSNHINLLNVTAALRGPPGSTLSQSQQPGRWPQPQPSGQSKTACELPYSGCEGNGSQGIQMKPLVKFCMTFSFICYRDVVFPGED